MSIVDNGQGQGFGFDFQSKFVCLMCISRLEHRIVLIKAFFATFSFVPALSAVNEKYLLSYEDVFARAFVHRSSRDTEIDSSPSHLRTMPVTALKACGRLCFGISFLIMSTTESGTIYLLDLKH